MSDIQGQRLNYLETVAKTKDGKEVVFTDPMNKFLDDLLIAVDANTAGAGASGTVTSVAVTGSDGIEIDSGSPITTTGTIALGLNKTSTLAFLNVEDGADVTDTANVTSAGALMDSEVTNLAQVKAFDATDYASALGVDDNYVTDAEKVVIGNTSGTNTGDMSNAQVKTAYELNANTNAFTDTEQTKLTGIETGANVTDAANVTAAGALMDSEVTNLAQVKAFDTTDYATAAQGAKADTAQGWGDHSLAGYSTVTSVDAIGARVTTNEGDITDLQAATGVGNLPSFSAWLTSSVSISSGTPTKLTGWTEEWDNGGDFSSDKFTVPASQAGRYLVTVQARFGVASSGDRLRIYIYKNGSSVIEASLTSGDAAVHSLNISRALNLSVSDYIEFYVENVDSSDTIARASDRTFFQVTKTLA